MLLCMRCGFQKPNYYKNHTCPVCESYLKYIEAAAKDTTIKFYKAGLHISYAVAEVYSYDSYAIHTPNICIGLAYPYQSVVFRGLPDGYEYMCQEEYIHEQKNRLPLEQLISPVQTYSVLRFESEYLDHTEAKAVLRQKLRELDSWIEEVISDGWLTICNLGGLLY